MSATHGTTASLFKQPRAVWAVAFACVISFMGIGLVDPILPSLAKNLHATPSQVSLLFTSYLVVTAVAMLVVGWVSSRIGAKRTLIIGLVLIVVFSALAGASGSIGGIVGFRAGWGVGNALFIATSLAVIVASASGGFGGAIILYEAALGLGIAVGPLLGGELGTISWRGPVLRRRRAHGRRPDRHDRVRPRPAQTRAPTHRWPPRSRHCATAACSPWASWRCCTTGASSPCSATRRTPWSSAPSNSAWSSPAGACWSPPSACSSRPACRPDSAPPRCSTPTWSGSVSS